MFSEAKPNEQKSNEPKPNAAKLLLLCPDPADAFDRKGRPPGFFGDFAVLFANERSRRLVTVEPAKQLGRHAAVGAHGIVFIDDVEKGELALGVGSGFFRHARLVIDPSVAVKRK